MRIGFTLAILVFASLASAQSFNVDFDVTSGAPAGGGGSSFGGAAGQLGFWNTIQDIHAPAVTLKKLNGQNSNVVLTRSATATTVVAQTGAASGGWRAVLEDVHLSSPGQSLPYAFSNLEPGTYAVFVYAIKPDDTLHSKVSVPNSTSAPLQECGSVWIANKFLAGRTHTVHVVTVPSGGSVNINVLPLDGFSRTAVGGIQLVKLDGTRLRFYVDDQLGTATDYSGRSWENHLSTLNSALDLAARVGGPNCELWVASGSYRCAPNGDRNSSFVIPSGLHLLGGFSGDEAVIEDRQSPCCTRLAGAVGNGVDPSDDAYTVVIADNTSADTLIDSVEIRTANNDSPDPNFGGYGGGVRMVNGSAVFRGCTFASNRAAHGGGGVYSQSGSPTFIDCYFVRNEAEGGAGFYHQSGGNVRFHNCRLVSNFADYGGAVFMIGANLLIANSYFQDNHAADRGGAVLTSASTASTTLLNCTLSANHAGNGGGVLAESGSDVYLRNSLFWFNRDDTGGPLLNQQYRAYGIGTVLVAASTSAEGAAGFDGLYPEFVDADGWNNVLGDYDDNLRLKPGSPCIDSGNNLFLVADASDVDADGDLLEPLPFDFDFAPRRVDQWATADAGSGIAPFVDRGAWEQRSSALVGDCDEDGDVDAADFELLSSCFSGPVAPTPTYACYCADLDGDGDIDLADFSELQVWFN